jgi:hypothetical protein
MYVPAVRADDVVSGDPDDAAVVRVPVALLEDDETMAVADGAERISGRIRIEPLTGENPTK